MGTGGLKREGGTLAKEPSGASTEYEYRESRRLIWLYGRDLKAFSKVALRFTVTASSSARS